MSAGRSRPRQALGLAGWLGITFAAAGIGAVASANAGGFYAELDRPVWAPPSWVFAPVWTALYVVMAIAAWLVWRRQGFATAGTALGLYLVQLAANALWTWLFFAWRMGAQAFVEGLVLWALVAATIVAFRRVDRVAAALLVPYLVWVTFAVALTHAVWRANPDALG